MVRQQFTVVIIQSSGGQGKLDRYKEENACIHPSSVSTLSRSARYLIPRPKQTATWRTPQRLETIDFISRSSLSQKPMWLLAVGNSSILVVSTVYCARKRQISSTSPEEPRSLNERPCSGHGASYSLFPSCFFLPSQKFPSPDTMENVLAEQLMKAATMVEERLDQEINEMANLDEDGLEALRRKRLAEMKQKQAQKMELLANGHGKYEEVADEREFFAATKKSDRVVCHFYQESEMRCKVVHKHLQKLAAKYMSTRFIYVNAEKVKFLITRLNIRIIPTICVIINQKTSDYVRVFEELGKSDDFKTEVLEARLGKSGAIDYEGVNPVTGMRGGDLKKGAQKGVRKIIRGPAKQRKDDDSDASDDW
uniref:Thioredoxin domain-containing protein 9 n=1 Tax=Steinernema glaseri TaxID=37863 RepID=A0A1I7ZZX4_9BILA